MAAFESAKFGSLQMEESRSASAPAPAFDAWLLKQTVRGGFVGQLATAAGTDRRFPKAGNPKAMRAHLRVAMADGDMFDAVEDAEANCWAGRDA